MSEDLFPSASALHRKGWSMKSDRVQWTKQRGAWEAEVASSHRVGQFRWFVVLLDGPIGFAMSGETDSAEDASAIAEVVLDHLATMPADVIARTLAAQKRVDAMDDADRADRDARHARRRAPR
jgi:hypothetical protein